MNLRNKDGSQKMGYLLELRKVVGKRTVVTVGASVII